MARSIPKPPSPRKGACKRAKKRLLWYNTCMLSEILEFGMLFAFGFSWPFAIMKTCRAKRVDGKSPMFMAIVIAGYCCGIAAHLVDGTKLWLCWVYLADMALVATDLTLYFHYYRKNRRNNNQGGFTP